MIDAYLKYEGQIKMTHQDAISKMPMGFENLPAALEALGLIEFEEEKDNTVANIIGFSFSQLKSYKGGDLTGVGRAFVLDLEKSGYEIVKKESDAHKELRRKVERGLI